MIPPTAPLPMMNRLWMLGIVRSLWGDDEPYVLVRMGVSPGDSSALVSPQRGDGQYPLGDYGNAAETAGSIADCSPSGTGHLRLWDNDPNA